MSVKRANDKYRAALRATFVYGVDTSFDVTAIPTNVPTYIVLGWETEFEAVYEVTAASGDSPSNYTLTGATYVKGYEGNQAEGTTVNCLNNEEFFNQYETIINEVQEIAEDAETSAISVTTITSSATPTPVRTTTRTKLNITALAAAAELQNPTGTPEDGDTLVVRIKDNGSARALTYDDEYREIGVELPDTTTISKNLYLAFMFNGTDTKWDLLAATEEE